MRISDWSSDVCSSDLHQVVLKQVIETGLPMVYANKVGGQDELVFDGASFAFNADRTPAFQMSQFETAITVTDWKKEGDGWRRTHGPTARVPEKEEADYRACVMGFRDYVNKNGFKSVVLGLRSEEHKSELQSLMRNTYAVFCL